MKKVFWTRLKPALLLSAGVAFLLFIYAPIDLYSANIMDFSFDLFDILQYFPLLAFCFFVLMSLISVFFSRASARIYAAYLAVFAVVFIALVVQGVFLTKNLPLLDGADIDWADYSKLKLSSAVVWGLSFVSALLIFLFWKKLRGSTLVSYIGGFGLLFLIVSLVTGCLSNTAVLTDKNDVFMTADGMMDASTNENFYILLLDSIDEKAFEDYLRHNPATEENLSDFTLFSNTLASYPYTTRAVPYILFGNVYDNSLYYPYWIEESVEHSEFMRALEEKGYNKNVFFEYIQRADIPEGMFGNFRSLDKFTDPVKFCKMIVKLTGLKYAPFSLKKYCVLTPDDIYFDTLKTSSDKSVDYYSFDNRDFYQRITTEDLTVSGKNQFSFLYVNGAHYPYLYDGTLNPIENGTYDDALRSSVEIINVFLKKLKDAGVYDNSVVVILADHGICLEEPTSSEKKQNPMLMIKGRGEAHEFRKNDAPVSHADLQQAFVSLCSGSSSGECFIWHEGDQRERIFYQSDVVAEDPITELKTNSHASDYSALKATGRIYEFDWNTAVPVGK